MYRIIIPVEEDMKLAFQLAHQDDDANDEPYEEEFRTVNKGGRGKAAVRSFKWTELALDRLAWERWENEFADYQA